MVKVEEVGKLNADNPSSRAKQSRVVVEEPTSIGNSEIPSLSNTATSDWFAAFKANQPSTQISRSGARESSTASLQQELELAKHSIKKLDRTQALEETVTKPRNQEKTPAEQQRRT
ncbi:uncharacterized protein TrAtP1_006643 [Trichoderma atroviride]|uniref:uncharacterized protein n=1 Tax=Hypocrea atroviridis TaxID=63577 RepID=UPI00331A9CBA|nr:hypothetical protein TrAtP1_006643 [Trichoderma atroviride]